MVRFADAVRSLATIPPRGSVAREAAVLRRAAIVTSTRLAGSALDEAETAMLLDRGLAIGGHPLRDYLIVRDYAEAERFALERRRLEPGDRRPFFTLDDIRRLHRLAARSESVSAPGAWRAANLPPGPTGTVHPPPWLVPREIDGIVDRFARGPGQEPVPEWCARLAGRFARIEPFATANGRVGRLLIDLVFARLGLPPLAFGGAFGRRYPGALSAAVAGDVAPFATLIARVALVAIDRLRAAGDVDTTALVPLAEEPAAVREGLYKAAQRGRLRTLVRSGRLYTTRDWIENYRRSRSRAGRPAGNA